MPGWQVKVLDITTNSLKSSSVKGLPRIFKVETALLRWLWISSVLSFLCTSFYFVLSISIEFFERSTIIDYKQVIPTNEGNDYGIKKSFPKLTLCNLKPIHAKDDATAISLMEYLDQVRDNMTVFTKQDPERARRRRSEFENLYTTQAYFEFVGRDEALQFGQALEDFIVSCAVTSESGRIYPCRSVATFETIESPKYIHCHSITMTEDAVMTRNPYKISVILHLSNEDDYIHTGFSRISNDLQASGALMRLESGIRDDNRKDIFLSPGSLTAVDISRGLTIRLPDPYGDCLTHPKTQLYSGRNGKPLQYSPERCRLACIQRAVSDECQCLKANSLALTSPEERKQLFCAASRETFVDRMKSFACGLNATADANEVCLVKCPRLCEEVRIAAQISTSAWLRDSQKLGFFTEAIKGRSFEGKYTEYRPLAESAMEDRMSVSDLLAELGKIDKIEKNFLKAEVALSDAHVSVIETKIKMSAWDAASSIASLINMFSGITIIVLVEFLDYFIHLVYLCCKKTETPMKEPSPPDKRGMHGIEFHGSDFNVYL